MPSPSTPAAPTAVPVPSTRAPSGSRAVAEPAGAVLRIGDAERSEAVARLGDHHVAGRLDTAEFDERAAAAFRARTAEDLAALFTDLPAPPVPAPPRPSRAPLVVALVVAVLGMWTIWLLTGAGHPWPLYPMTGLVPMLFLGATCGARRT